jgi:hypothetical protein
MHCSEGYSRLTTWRSAANAPDKKQSALMMRGAFGCCNGVLGGTRIARENVSLVRLFAFKVSELARNTG